MAVITKPDGVDHEIWSLCRRAHWTPLTSPTEVRHRPPGGRRVVR